jgi:4-hydroxy-tetrahydrodipicolinate synthase
MELACALEGVIPVLPVPFADDQSVDLAAFDAEVRWAVERPVDGVALFGLASEYWKLSDPERFARRVVEIGADALIVMPPHFMTPKAEKVIDHCRAVADAVAPRPVVIQYSPAYVGVSLSAETFVRMQERSPNIAYVKVEPRPPGPMIEAIRAASGGRLGCLIGQGGLTLADCRRRGIAGLMPGVAVVEVYRTLWDGLARDPVDQSILDLNDRMVALMSHIVPTIDMWVAAEKQMLAWRGVIDRPGLRDPSSLPERGFFEYLRCCFERLAADLQRKENG